MSTTSILSCIHVPTMKRTTTPNLYIVQRYHINVIIGAQLHVAIKDIRMFGRNYLCSERELELFFIPIIFIINQTYAVDMPILVWSVYMKGTCYLLQTARIKTHYDQCRNPWPYMHDLLPFGRELCGLRTVALRRCIIEGNLPCDR